MTRTTLLAAATFAAMATSALTPNAALAKIETLGGCYDAVITFCNDKHPNHAQECAGGGMDECDEEFANMSGGGIDSLKVLVQPNRGNGPKTFKWKMVQRAEADYFLKIDTIEGESENNPSPTRSR